MSNKTELLRKYEKLLQEGYSILLELEEKNLTESFHYRSQKLLNSIWKMVLKDLESLPDKNDDEHKT